MLNFNFLDLELATHGLFYAQKVTLKDAKINNPKKTHQQK